jgi:cytosine/adenosine deaminase-related metal-dependent hydrolase
LHPGTARELTACFDLVTTSPARLMNPDFCGIAIGHSADVVVLGCADPAAAVAELAQSETLLASLSTPVRPTMQPYPSTSLGTATVT